MPTLNRASLSLLRLAMCEENQELKARITGVARATLELDSRVRAFETEVSRSLGLEESIRHMQRTECRGKLVMEVVQASDSGDRRLASASSTASSTTGGRR